MHTRHVSSTYGWSHPPLVERHESQHGRNLVRDFGGLSMPRCYHSAGSPSQKCRRCAGTRSSQSGSFGNRCAHCLRYAGLIKSISHGQCSRLDEVWGLLFWKDRHRTPRYSGRIGLKMVATVRAHGRQPGTPVWVGYHIRAVALLCIPQLCTRPSNGLSSLTDYRFPSFSGRIQTVVPRSAASNRWEGHFGRFQKTQGSGTYTHTLESRKRGVCLSYSGHWDQEKIGTRNVVTYTLSGELLQALFNWDQRYRYQVEIEPFKASILGQSNSLAANYPACCPATDRTYLASENHVNSILRTRSADASPLVFDLTRYELECEVRLLASQRASS
jgi:hypothetical protein